MERQEEVLDRAYADMREMAPTVGERAVEVITAHYLGGEDWHDLSARTGIAYDKCKKIAYRAFWEYDAATLRRPQGSEPLRPFCFRFSGVVYDLRPAL